MPLINCPECQREISDQAISCPQCGYQLKTKTETTTTVQLTSKKLKKRQLYPLAFMFLAFPFILMRQFAIGFIIVGISIIWSIVIGMQIWWEHK